LSFWDRDIDDWFRRFGFGTMRRTGGGSGSGGSSIFREFEEMRREMERLFEETVQNVDRMPKDLVREYETPEGGKVREAGPLVYGYSVTVGPDGKPHVREFGNVKPIAGATAPQLTAEREPLADVVTTDKEVKVVVEMPGVHKEDIKINAFDNSIEISTAEGAQRKYRRVVELPPDAEANTAKSTYNNGILEIVFSKRTKPKAKEIKVE
jgi:HSP20 family protein